MFVNIFKFRSVLDIYDLVLNFSGNYRFYPLQILDQYRESRDSRSKDGVEVSENLPTSVILVGHSMGGFVARAALVHPHLQNSAVETIVTLSSPHQ